MSSFDDYDAAYRRLGEAGVETKGGAASAAGWTIEAVYTNPDDVGELMTLSSLSEVDAFLAARCPSCGTLDEERKADEACGCCGAQR